MVHHYASWFCCNILVHHYASCQLFIELSASYHNKGIMHVCYTDHLWHNHLGWSPFYEHKWHWIWVWINNYIHALLWIISPIHSLTFVNIWVFIISIYNIPPLLKIRLLMYILGGGWTHRKGIQNSQPIQYDKITNLGRQGTNLNRNYITDSIFNGN